MASRILFVDDEGAMHFAMREYLGAMGYLVDSVRNAPDAFDRMKQTRYEVVIADLRLSSDFSTQAEPEGLALVERVRREYAGTRVLVFTACGDDLAREAIRRGADWVLQKPQPLRRVADVLNVLCRSMTGS